MIALRPWPVRAGPGGLQADSGEISRPWSVSPVVASGWRARRTSLTVVQIGPTTLATIAMTESVIVSHGGSVWLVQTVPPGEDVEQTGPTVNTAAVAIAAKTTSG